MLILKNWWVLWQSIKEQIAHTIWGTHQWTLLNLWDFGNQQYNPQTGKWLYVKRGESIHKRKCRLCQTVEYAWGKDLDAPASEEIMRVVTTITAIFRSKYSHAV